MRLRSEKRGVVQLCTRPYYNILQKLEVPPMIVLNKTVELTVSALSKFHHKHCPMLVGASKSPLVTGTVTLTSILSKHSCSAYQYQLLEITISFGGRRLALASEM